MECLCSKLEGEMVKVLRGLWNNTISSYSWFLWNKALRYAKKVLNWKELWRALHACLKSWLKSSSGTAQVKWAVRVYFILWLLLEVSARHLLRVLLQDNYTGGVFATGYVSAGGRVLWDVLWCRYFTWTLQLILQQCMLFFYHFRCSSL